MDKNKNITGIPPEILAVISTSIDMVFKQERDELMAAMSAAIVHSRSAGIAVRFQRSQLWTVAGRIQGMSSRL